MPNNPDNEIAPTHEPSNSKEFISLSVANLIAEHKCFYLGKIETPGEFFIPFILDIKKLYSSPQSLKLLGQEIGNLANRLPIDKIAGIETASIPIAAAASLISNIPMVYVRKNRKKHGTKGFIEGKFQPGDRIALIDDVIGPGYATKTIYNNCLQEKVRINHMILVAHDPIPKPWAKEACLQFHQLLYIKDLWKYLVDKGAINSQIYDSIIMWQHNMKDWQQKKHLWQNYLELINRVQPENCYPY